MKKLLKSLNLDKIKGYTYFKELSGGKMSWTCLYRNSSNQKAVVKFLFHPKDKSSLDNFKQEIESIKCINLMNPSYRPKLILDLKERKKYNIYYFMVEYINGKCLDDYIKSNKLPWDEKKSTEFIYKIADELHTVVSSFIIHKDLHEKNILLINNKEIPDIKIIDFGISSNWLKTALMNFSLEGRFRHMGAVSSWSPEYIKNPSKIGVSHDIWALGVLYYRFLTNKHPFYSKNFEEYYDLVTNALLNYGNLRDFGINPFIIRILSRCFTLEPEERISFRLFKKMCYDYLNNFETLTNDDSLLEFYYEYDGDIWRCPRCSKIVHPSGNMCTLCGYRGDDFDFLSFEMGNI